MARAQMLFSASLSPLCLTLHPLSVPSPPSQKTKSQAKALKPLPRGGKDGAVPAPRRTVLAPRPLVAPVLAPFSAAKASLAASSGDGSNDKLLGVEKKTLIKVMALGAMFFSILFNYTILRDTKVSCSWMGEDGERERERKRAWRDGGFFFR